MSIQDIFLKAKRNAEIVEQKSTDSVVNKIIASLVHEMVFCPDCGMSITPPDAKYCWNCGSELEPLRYKIENDITVNLPLNKLTIAGLNKLAMDSIDEVEEFDFETQTYLQLFCDALIENNIATAALCKKLGSMFSRLQELENAIHYYYTAMDIDPEMDLSAQIARLRREIYSLK